MTNREFQILAESARSASRVLSEGHERETPGQEYRTMPPPRLTPELLLTALTQTDVILGEPVGSSARQLAASVAPECEHRRPMVLEIAGGVDGFSMHYLQCRDCGYLFTVTKWAGRETVDVEPMTPGAAVRYGARE